MEYKKVLIFSFAYYPHVGGAEVAIKEITDRLNGVQFDLITYNLGNEIAEERVGNVNVYRISSLTKYLYPLKSFFKGLILERKNQYDVVWSVMANAGFGALFLKLFFPRIKFVLTIQEGDPIPQIKRRVWFAYPVFKMIFKKADRVTAISNYLANFAREMGSETVEVIPNGVDLKKFSTCPTARRVSNFEFSIGEREKIILVTTGRLVKKNAVDDIIRALKFLPGNVILKSIGSGEDESYLRELVKDLGLGERVEFLPYADHSIVFKILEESDIFIRPSLSEGLGNSFLEAMAVGLPIIGTKVGGIPDFLEDGETGLFCGIRDPEDIARKVSQLARDRELYAKISRNGRKLVEEGYDWGMITRRFETVFNS